MQSDGAVIYFKSFQTKIPAREETLTAGFLYSDNEGLNNMVYFTYTLILLIFFAKLSTYVYK